MSADPGFAAVTSLLREVVLRLERIEAAIEGSRATSRAENSNARLWTVSEVAEFLSRSKRSVYQLAAAGELPALRFGGHLRFDPADIRSWVRRTTTQ